MKNCRFEMGQSKFLAAELKYTFIRKTQLLRKDMRNSVQKEQ